VFVTVKTGTCDLAHADQPLLDAYRNHLTSDPQRRPIQAPAAFYLRPPYLPISPVSPRGGRLLVQYQDGVLP
jgi:hypothetical protein